MKVVMIGADRSVMGGVSAVVNNLYRAGLDKRVDLTYIGTVTDGPKLKKLWKGMTALVRFCFCMSGTDLVHVNMAADASCRRKMLFMRLAYLFGKKVVIHEHGGDFQGFYFRRCSPGQQKKIRRVLNRAALFLVLSEEWKAFFETILDHVRIEVLENAVPVPESGKTDYSGHRVLFLGRLCREKGIGELLEAAPRVRARVPDFELILGGFWEAGNGELEKKAEELSAYVHCPGWVKGEEKERLLRECSVFVLPTWFEGQPVSLLETMAAGMCVAASAVGGIPQILGTQREAGEVFYGPAETGYLLKEKDGQALADALVCLLKDAALREQMGRCARQRIRERYEIGSYLERLLALYKGVLV